MNLDKDNLKVTVIGLGKIGLTIASVIAEKGIKVYGVDKNPHVVEQVNKGICHIKGEPGLEELVKENQIAQVLTCTINTKEAVSNSNVVIVIVPVLITSDNQVDYQYIDEAVNQIGQSIKKDTLVIFETTLPTGDTRNRFGSSIEKLSGLKMGTEFYLAYSPERVYSNRIIKNLKDYPKVVGGVNEKSKDLAVSFYRRALKCEVIEMSSTEAAEFAKVAESVYRDVNIALANELSVYANQKGVNILEIIKASNSQPFSHIHNPGIGVGGHCIPIYPYFFLNNGLSTDGLVHKAREINDSMAVYSVNLIEKEVGKLDSLNILILGLSFRENVKEHTKSITLLLNEILNEKNANVVVNDPYYSPAEVEDMDLKYISLQDHLVCDMDIVILQANHSEYNNLDLSMLKNCKVFLDGRNAFNRNEVEVQGIKYIGIGAT
ncbi:nucleotide sugar dehydrogenase [Rossellomorea aquimaris]|uniref:Nucleotide sugar dehydrogenase n=1 Tax=Rossellomorea aquimaris TaxID=189382 RepID=A0A366EXS9_9BACI|nr:nucleotide sugar dehydrogenase [Rossellomorea aquimaris]RBP06726.1 nucleotide sugar dehydrogenase [Rossellomorea aquimaris]